MLYNTSGTDSSSTGQLTAMVSTSGDGRLEAVKLAKRKDTDLRLYENYDKTTAFIRASQGGQISIVKLMLKKEVNFDPERTTRLTDLMAASVNGNTEIVKLLLEKGANPDLKDNEGRTALDFAGNPDIRQLLAK